jgi:transglutaminase-like putative cysteine protease
MVMCVAWAIVSARWVEDLQIVELAALVGLIAGILLAKTRFSALVAHVFGLVYGAAWISYLGTSLVPSTFTLRERLFELGYHVNAWLWKVLTGGSSSDSLMFVLFLACVLWLLGYMAAWATFRTYRVWWAILPTATVLFINVYWGPPRMLIFLIAYVALVLLFFVRFNLFRQQQVWSAARVRYDSEIVWDFLRYGLVFVVVVMTLAWGAPGAAASQRVATFWENFSEPWERVQDVWNRLFFASSYYGSAQPNMFGPTLSLGGAVHLGNRVIMDVASPAGRYWRATVYDEYGGSGWVNNDEDMAYLTPFDPEFVVPSFIMRQTITQTYTSYLPGRTQLFAAAEPVAVDRRIKARASRIGGHLSADGRRGEFLNVSMLYARMPLESGEEYTVLSALSAAYEDSLRAAGTDYPRWVADRYLQLPDSLPQRVRDLAEEITRDQTNPYDKAAAIQDYLRQIPYNELIESPPLDQDKVDWFLFDLQEGYCDYYASSLIVMARAVGVPARMAVGYTRGDYEAEAGVFRVRESHGHAWVEVFFPEYGWVEFEPTAAEPVIVRPRLASGNDNGARSDEESSRDRGEDWDGGEEDIGDGYYPFDFPGRPNPWVVRTLWVVGGLLTVTAVVGGSYWWLEQRGLARLGVVRKVYARMVRLGRLLRVREKETQTPYEYAEELSAEVPLGRRPIHRIAELFVQDRFSPRPANEGASVVAWHELRSRMWRRWFGRWLERIQAPPEE